MAIFDTLLPNIFASDITGVFDQNFRQVFYGARPIKAIVKETSKVMEHPVETGSVITDHRIINPIEIELSLIIVPNQINTPIALAVNTDSESVRNIYAEIREFYLKGTLLTVQTKTSSYSNMLISDLPHEEDPALFNAITIALKLKQVQFVSAQFATLPKSKVANPANASTDKKGEVQARPASATTPSQSGGVLVKMVDYIGGAF